MGAPIGDRLRRLRAPAEDEPAAVQDFAPALAKVERPPGGDLSDGLSLKERLERLIASTRTRSPVRPPQAVPVEELVQGMRVKNEQGEFFCAETDSHLDSYHGAVSLSRFRAVAAANVAVLAGTPDCASFDLARAVFLDTETTGLAGGTGTAAFLIGIGFVDGERFRVRQYFMRDYHEESALLAGLAEDLKRFRHLVTFNGKMFDVPLLETRFRLCRSTFPLTQAPHLDLLHPARRLWKRRLESCRLQSLEGALLGLHRHGDIGGAEIPEIYFDYVRRRDGRALARVFEHNRLDIVSLAALAVLAADWMEGAGAEDPRDVYSLARVLERARLEERSAALYRRVGAGPLRNASLLRLAAQARRSGQRGDAVRLWQEAAEEGDLSALRQLAIDHEHRRRDPAAALRVVDEAMDLLRRGHEPTARRLGADFEKRRRRLVSRLDPARGR